MTHEKLRLISLYKLTVYIPLTDAKTCVSMFMKMAIGTWSGM